MQTEPNRYVPAGAVRVADKTSDAVAYIYTDAKNRPCARVFYGKQSKPVAAFYFKTEAERAKSVKGYFEGRQATIRRKTDVRKARTEYVHDYKVGDILVCSWGYSMTIVDFYVVTEVKGKQIVICEIGKKIVRPDGAGDGRVTADPSRIIGAPMTKRPDQHGYVRINSHSHAKKWDGNDKYYNTYD